MTENTSFASSATQPAHPTTAPADAWRIDPERAVALTQPPIAPGLLELVDETGSTNTDLMSRMKALPREGVPYGVQAVRVAYRQTAGRGRQGRRWQAAPGHALTFSVACLLPRPLSGLAGLSLAVGVALVEGLRALPGLAANDARRIALKWPNDVLLDGGKLAGTLVETAWNTPLITAAVIGIGLNLRRDDALASELASTAAAMPAEVRATPPAALSQIAAHADFTDTLAAALAALTGMLECFAIEGFEPFRARWTDYHAYAGREVVLLEGGVEFARGTALGVDSLGQLQLATAQGVRAIATGDVSLRLAQATS